MEQVAKIDLKGIVHLDHLESTLSLMINKINKQESLISHLMSLCSTFMTQSDALTKFAALESNYFSIAEKVDRLQKFATSIADGKEVSAGELSSANFLEIKKLESSLKKYAKAVVVERELESIRVNQAIELEKIYNWSSPLELTTKIQHTQHDMNIRMLGIERMLPCKIDRTDIDKLDTLASGLLKYDEFLRKTADAIKNLQSQVACSAELLSKDGDRLSSLESALKIIGSDISLFPDFNDLLKQLERTNKSIEELTTKSSFDMLQDKVRDCQCALESLTQQNVIRDESIEHLTLGIANSATREAMLQCVSRVDYEETMTVLAASMDSKAGLDDLVRLEERSEELAITLRDCIEVIDDHIINHPVRPVKDWISRRPWRLGFAP